MKKQTKAALCVALIFTILSLLFIVVLKFVDVQAIGPEETKVGLATVNGAVRDFIGVDEFWYAVSGIMGYVGFAAVGILVLFGLCQLIKRKSLFKVDSAILAAGILFVVVAVLYVVFDKFVVINMRPIYEDGELESSFPSTHTMLAICIYGATIAVLSAMVSDCGMKWFPRIILGAFMVLQVVARALSGYHWITDIAGAVLLSVALLGWFATAKGLIDRAKEKKEATNEL